MPKNTQEKALPHQLIVRNNSIETFYFAARSSTSSPIIFAIVYCFAIGHAGLVSKETSFFIGYGAESVPETIQVVFRIVSCCCGSLEKDILHFFFILFSHHTIDFFSLQCQL